MTVEQLLASARKRAGLRQWQAAQGLHMDRATLSLYESGRRQAPREVLAAAGRLYRAPELLAMAGEGPWAVRFVADEDVAVSMDWFVEEAAEALAAAERIVRALRRGETPSVEDAADVVDLRFALDTFLVAAWRSGCPVEAGYERHLAKVRRHLARREAA